MLKLTSALIQQSPEILKRLKTSPELEECSDLFTLEALTSLLRFIDSMRDVTSHDHDAHLGYDPLNQAVYGLLTRLSLAQATLLFLSLEELVMRSGRGTEFNLWRNAWRRALVTWIAQSEVSRSVRSALTSLSPLGTSQKALWRSYQDTGARFTQQLSEYVLRYLDPKSALPNQVIIEISAELSPHFSRWRAHWLTQVTNIFGDHSHHFHLTARPHLPLSSLTQLVESLRPLKALSSTAPLLHALLDHGALPLTFQQTPKASRRVWLMRELGQLIFSTSALPLFIRLDQAQFLSSLERSIWIELGLEAKRRDRAFVLILSGDHHGEAPLNEPAYARLRGLNYTYLQLDHLSSAQEDLDLIQNWDGRWSSSLMGETRPLSNASSRQIWEETFSALGLGRQLELLCLSVHWGTKALGHSGDDLKPFIDAGWLTHPSMTPTYTTDALTECIDRLAQHPQELLHSHPHLVSSLQSLFTPKDHASPQRPHSETPTGLKGLQALVESAWLEAALQGSLDPLHQQVTLTHQFLDLFGLCTDEMISVYIPPNPMAIWAHETLLNSLQTLSHDQASTGIDQALSVIEVAHTLGDLTLLAQGLYAEARSLSLRGAIVPALRSYASAQLTWWRLGEDTQAQRCRLEVIITLALNGSPRAARMLLHTEDEQLIVSSIHRLTLKLSQGIISLYLGEWRDALSALRAAREIQTSAQGEARWKGIVQVFEGLASLFSMQSCHEQPHKEMARRERTQIEHQLREIIRDAQDTRRAHPLSLDLYLLCCFVEASSAEQLKDQAALSSIGEELARLLHAHSSEVDLSFSRGSIYLYWIYQVGDQDALGMGGLWRPETLKHQANQAMNYLAKARADLIKDIRSSSLLDHLLSPAAHKSYQQSISRFADVELDVTYPEWELRLPPPVMWMHQQTNPLS